MSGWYAIKRGITKHHIFQGYPERLAIWMWLLDNAAWKATKHDINGTTITVERGSVCASERHIAREVGVGYQVVRTALKRFKSAHMVNARLTHGKNVITICNYSKYQDVEDSPNAGVNASLTQGQRKPNAQKEQGNKETREDTVVSSARETLEAVVSRDVVSDFLEHRKAMKKPVTERAARAMVKQLSGHPDADAVLTASIANGWQGIFPENIKAQFTPINGGQNGQSPSKSESRIRAWTQGARGAVGPS